VADTHRSSAQASAALTVTSPLLPAHCCFHVLQEPTHAAPDPERPFLPESNHLLVVHMALASRAIGAERIERPPRGLRPRMLPLHHAPPIFQGAEHESLRSQYAGKPATGCLGLLFVAMQVMVAGTQGLRVFQHADLGSAVAKPGGSTPRCFGISSASASPAARSARSSADATPGVRISAGKVYVYVI